MAADFGFVVYAAERDAVKVAAGRLGDGFAERGFADTGRADEADDRAFAVFVAFLYGEVVKDALFDVFEAVVVALQDFFGAGDVVLAAAALGPGVVNHPFEIVADDVGLGRHRRHLFEFVQFGQGFFFGVRAHAGVFDGFFQLFDVVERVFHFAQFFLDGFDLFVEVVLALVALHLLFDAAANFAVQVGFFQFFFEEDEDVLQAVVERGAVEDGDAPLQAEVRVRRFCG